MAYHVNENGEVGLCKAKSDNCPFGQAEAHYGSAEAARQAYEAKMEAAGSHLEAPSKEALEAELWAIVRERAKQDLTHEFSEAYAAHTLAYMDELRTQYPMAWGRTRAVFIRDATVIKVPLNGEGMLDSSREVAASLAYRKRPAVSTPIALTEASETEDGVGYVIAERVTPIAGRVDYNALPSWVGYVDCGQVGYTSEGVLVAYDL